MDNSQHQYKEHGEKRLRSQSFTDLKNGRVSEWERKTIAKQCSPMPLEIFHPLPRSPIYPFKSRSTMKSLSVKVSYVPKAQVTRGTQRLRLVEELYHLYGNGYNQANKLTFLRKKYCWLFVLEATKITKRMVDIIVSSLLLVVLSPLFITVALLIRLTDGGPVLYVAKRVGKWGKEFPFPKFRSMAINADGMKDKLLDQNDHDGGVTFKMKHDPRVTWIGRIIRKLSIDELPQLWCVLKGEMSLVGPRPPVPGEVALYTLSDRRRLDVIPGLTCIWQVSGRGDIPFPEQVALDLQYIRSQNVFLDIKLLLQSCSFHL